MKDLKIGLTNWKEVKMENNFEWCKFNWNTSFGWGQMHPEEKPRANCWYSGEGVKISSVNELVLDILYSPKTIEGVGSAEYSAGMVISNWKQFGLGIYELRARLPMGNWLWPAFWMYKESVGNGAEIDIIEGYSKNTQYAKYGLVCIQSGWNVESCVHTPKEFNLSPTPTKAMKPWQLENPDRIFNDYILNWERDRLEFYVNYTLVRTISDKDVMDYLYENAHGQMSVIINTHIEGNNYKKFSLNDYISPYIVSSFKYFPK